jgi:hypothetical protein
MASELGGTVKRIRLLVEYYLKGDSFLVDTCDTSSAR